MKDAATVQKASAVEYGRVCTICVALLGQSGKLESAIAARKNPMESINVDGFSKLLDTVGVQCTPQDKQAIFTMIDPEGHGTIEAKALKTALRKSGAISRMYEDSLRTFGLLLAATLLFDAGIYTVKGGTAAFDFLTAYVIEDSLSVDNLFVFLLIFRAFKVPPQLVDPCLNYGIFGSIVLRGFFIFAGLAAVSAFQPLLLGFSGFLLYTSYQILTDAEEEEEPDVPPLVTAVLKRLPLSNTFEGAAFTVPSADGKGVLLTQFTATLVCIALSDVLFAVDSVPAVLAVSNDPFVVYTSNIAAVVGLRSLYQLLSVAVSDLVYLEKAVAYVLGFVGLKLAGEVVGFEISSALSLAVILSTLGGGVLLSLNDARALDQSDFPER